MRIVKNVLLASALFAGMTGWAAQSQQLTVDQVIDRIVQREAQETATLRQYSPTIETYVQDMRTDKDAGLSAATDHYFLGKAFLNQDIVQEGASEKPKKGGKDKNEKKEMKEKRNALGGLSGVFPKESVLDGFLQMVYVDPHGFDRQHYHFDYVRREFLGEVRCLVFNVTPTEGAGHGRFLGRIWVEDQDYTIVRLAGTHDSERSKGWRLHFDGWRINVAPGIWVPAFIYSAESEQHDMLGSQVRFRAQTRLWGYHAKVTTAGQDLSVEESQRARTREAEQNAMDRLEATGLLAPVGEVDKILSTVVNNLEVSNNLDIEPDVDCRVLLTSTLESFTIGHTVVVSRGLLDVLPDEASLALVLAHELGHILSGHSAADPWAFTEWNPFPSEGNFTHFDFPIVAHDEEQANAKALELLRKSPYKDKLGTAVAFLHVMDSQSKILPNLISPHVEARAVLATQLPSAAPRGAADKGELVAALPFGSRIKLDPWTDRVNVLKNKPVALDASEEPFHVGPYMPYLVRINSAGNANATSPTAKNE